MSCRILVVRLGAMGDLIHTLPAVASLKQNYPGCRLSWAVEKRWQYLLTDNPAVDELVEVNRDSLRALLELRRTLRERKFDFAVDFQGLVKSAVVASFARPEKLFGFDRSCVREQLACLFYSSTIKPKSAHIVDRNLELASAAGATHSLRLFPLPAGTPEGSLPIGPFVLANPLAGWKRKQWPREYYSELARRLDRECGIPLVVNAPHPLDIPGTRCHVSGMPGLVYATRRALAVVGVDSGPMHLAAALGKPGVAIFGPTDPSRNGPYGDTMSVLRSETAETSYKRGATVDPAMHAITPDQVLSALKLRMMQATNSG
jgi:heptosyltransferase-1